MLKLRRIEHMSNPFLEGNFVDESDVRAFNEFGRTLARFGIVKSLWMEYDIIETTVGGCGCGMCTEEDWSVGVGVYVGNNYVEYDIV